MSLLSRGAVLTELVFINDLLDTGNVDSGQQMS